MAQWVTEVRSCSLLISHHSARFAGCCLQTSSYILWPFLVHTSNPKSGPQSLQLLCNFENSKKPYYCSVRLLYPFSLEFLHLIEFTWIIFYQGQNDSNYIYFASRVIYVRIIFLRREKAGDVLLRVFFNEPENWLGSRMISARDFYVSPRTLSPKVDDRLKLTYLVITTEH